MGKSKNKVIAQREEKVLLLLYLALSYSWTKSYFIHQLHIIIITVTCYRLQDPVSYYSCSKVFRQVFLLQLRIVIQLSHLFQLSGYVISLRIEEVLQKNHQFSKLSVDFTRSLGLLNGKSCLINRTTPLSFSLQILVTYLESLQFSEIPTARNSTLK